MKAIVVGAVLLLSGSAARADEVALRSQVGLGTTVVPARAQITTLAGYAGGADEAVASATVEVAVIARLGLFAAVTYGEERAGATRPAIGAAFQITDPRTAPVGLRASLAYKPEGFDEPEGELEAVALASRAIGGHGLARAMVAYGRDPDGHESDVEAGASYLHGVTSELAVGASTRFRYALAVKDAAAPDWDLVAGASAAYVVHHWRFEALAGVDVLSAMTTKTGVLALGGVGFDL